MQSKVVCMHTTPMAYGYARDAPVGPTDAPDDAPDDAYCSVCALTLCLA